MGPFFFFAKDREVFKHELVSEYICLFFEFSAYGLYEMNKY